MKKIRIFNARRGLAANSSSSHSILLNSKGLKDKDCDEYGEFGWSHFIAASPEMKSLYIGILLSNFLYDIIPHPKSLIATVNTLMGRKSGLFVNKDNTIEGYIDHQSHFGIPSAFGTEFPDPQFVKELTDFLMQDNVAILGGNDNEDNPVDFPVGSHFPFKYDDDSKDWTCRKDSKYDYWVIFNRKTGCKIRFQFINDFEKMKDVPNRSEFPELVDIKITNRCPYADSKDKNACSNFCYQSSSLDGKHMDERVSWYLADALGEMNVFEVAIGGGEPTIHPDFVSILGDFKRNGIVPNFTTRNLSWIHNDKLRNRILENCGSFAYSVRDYHEVEDFSYLMNKFEMNKDQASVQMVMGTIPMYKFEWILKECAKKDIRINLLGFKKTGKGVGFKKENDYSKWLDVIDKMDNVPDICIDTLLAKEYESELIEKRYPRWSFHIDEGKFSCYIDAVEGKMGTSSYCDQSELVDLKCKDEDWHRNLIEKIPKIFNQF